MSAPGHFHRTYDQTSYVLADAVRLYDSTRQSEAAAERTAPRTSPSQPASSRPGGNCRTPNGRRCSRYGNFILAPTTSPGESGSLASPAGRRSA
jgi:hypothetical protein